MQKPKGQDIAIVGWACRLPGAPSVDDLWRLLRDGRCSVTEVPADRWSRERFLHPDGERGRSYTFAAGVLDDIWGFDADAFGLSPREAEQMDPQQRLLLELVWEALEDAGIPPSTLAGTETGVFVGASTTDNGNARMFDMAGADGYFATGNAASIVSNRISYVYDLAGPSYTVDTACSSSLVALDAAIQSLRAGRCETAIVAGVNLLLTPFHFISFSQASMLSRRGLCQAYAAAADGYVRAEGGAVLVLRAGAAGGRSHATILDTLVNSDGRTNGIALPSQVRQTRLLRRLYGPERFDPDALAFVEAHGTGTQVGDVIEANALGDVLGAQRAVPLTIGSIKTNVGHTEAAAGMAGVLKAALALKHDLVPASLHSRTLNPRIDFDALNLRVAQDPVPLVRGERPRIAGVSAFGFGGTNAHAVLTDPAPETHGAATAQPSLLLISAHTRAALTSLAQAYADRLGASPALPPGWVAAANGRRDRLAERIAVPTGEPKTMAEALRAAASATDKSTRPPMASAVGKHAPVAFVYSGNGSQWAGMGRAAFRQSAAFREALAEVDAPFAALSGWSLSDLLSRDEGIDLQQTSVVQPLIFAIQVAATAALRRAGLAPAMVLGHSVGEVAAAVAAGLLDVATAARIIHCRSTHQERIAGTGGMAVLVGPHENATALVAEQAELSIAAWNSPRVITVSGPFDALDRLAKRARARRTRLQRLDLPYPFHSSLVDPIRMPLLAELGTVPTMPGTIPFVSTVTGTVLGAEALDAFYWWRNVREPVLFSRAVEEAFRLGARIFVEIGPDPILLSHIADSLADEVAPIATLAALDRSTKPGDPFLPSVAAALAAGAPVGPIVLGSDPGEPVRLPGYPWQRVQHRPPATPEGIGTLAPRPWHPLIGDRIAPGAAEWRAIVDTALVPVLADHVVDGHVLLPAAAFGEMALAVARDWFGTAAARVADFSIGHPLVLDPPVSRELRCRLEPSTGIVEIASRPRFVENGWQLHAVGKVLAGVPDAESVPAWPEKSEPAALTADTLYPAAREAGLDYGPAFRLLAEARRAGPDRIVVELIEAAADERYGLDPAQVDACFHGLVLVFRELAGTGPATAFVPVSFAELAADAPGIPIRRAVIDVRDRSPTAIVADLVLAGAAGQVVARYRGLRFQALNRTPRAERRIELFAAEQQLAAAPLGCADEPGLSAESVVAAARATSGVAADTPAQPGFDYVLLEGWASSVAFDVVRRFAVDGVVDLDRVRARLDGDALSHWCGTLLPLLARSDLAERLDAGRYRLVSDPGLPAPADVLATLAAEYPNLSADLLLAARLTASVADLGGPDAGPRTGFSPLALEAAEFGGLVAEGAAAWLGAIIAVLDGGWPRQRALRILQLGDGPAFAPLAEAAARLGAELTLVDGDRRRLERARLAAGPRTGVAFIDGLAQLPSKGFDLAITCQTLGRLADDPAWGGAVREALAPGAVVLAIEPEPSLFRAVVFGCPLGEPPADPHASSGLDPQRMLAPLALQDLSVVPGAVGRGSLVVVGQTGQERGGSVAGRALVIGQGEIPSAFARMLQFSGIEVDATTRLDAGVPPGSDPSRVVLFPRFDPDRPAAGQIAGACLDLRDFVSKAGPSAVRLWIIGVVGVSGAVQAAVRGFARCLANEVASLDVRFIDLAADVPAEVAARRLKDIVFSETAEAEVSVGAETTHVTRYDRIELPAPATGREEALRLVKGDGAGLDRVAWRKTDRPAPAPGEVEIAVEAAGLNFRDVMWALSVLPDEILEDGYAGPNLGLECAGRVVGVGPGVERFEPGDAVIAFARAALATHVTVPEAFVAPRPAGLSAEAGATVPVAFLTAFYGLIDRARLAADEWVLIHGGAGGVGMAALQIARWRGARIIATAGTAERRDLLRMLGAEHVFDSRSTAFVADVRRVTGAGVHVVLNSLSGEAMERSIDVLRPFGRFVELGKRDYVANTHIGLKPFRRNLSYFGVDLDQLMLWEEAVGRATLDSVMRLFDEGTLTPLPYRTFGAAGTVEAFRLMQRSGHIGKIVIRPPKAPVATAAREPFRIAGDRTHLVTGGLSGFGLAAARWLADHGARHLVLVGRSGASRPEAAAAVEALRADGVAVHVAPVDVADAADTADLLAEIARTLPPLGGVIHAAAVYADAIAANLDRDRFDEVLRAKATGAAVLDRLTRPMPLDYFILFSSATTMIGNPGQGAYVAANAFLEGLAAERQRAGLPGLAVAWGAIEDVGVLTRSSAAATNLLARAGVHGMPAHAALDRLHAVLSSPASTGMATITIAAVNWSAAQAHLNTLKTPAFARLAGGAEAGGADETRRISVRELLQAEGQDKAVAVVGEVVRDEIARILRMPRDDVGQTKPLMEIGLDSLMGVELAMALEQRFVLDAQLSQSAGTMTVRQLAEYLVGLADQARTQRDETPERLALRHLDPDLHQTVLEALPRAAKGASTHAPETVG